MRFYFLLLAFLVANFFSEAQKAVLLQSFTSESTYNSFTFSESNFYIDKGQTLEGFNLKRRNTFSTTAFGGKIASPLGSVKDKALYKGYNSFQSVFTSDSLTTDKIIESISNIDLKIYSGKDFSLVFDDNSIYATDGSKEGTEEILSGETFRWWMGNAIYVESEEKFYITISTTSENKVYSTDGTKDGTQLLASYILPQERHTFVYSPDSVLHFVQNTPDTVKIYEILKESGHLELMTIFPANSFLQNQISITDGKVVFVGPDPDRPYTTSRLLYAIEDDSVVALKALKEPTGFLGYYNSDIVFYSNVEANKASLFISNGTSEGTRIIHNNIETKNIVQYGNDLYFLGMDEEHGAEVWKYDGSEASLLMDLEEGSIGLKDINFHILDGALYFAARLTRDLTLTNLYKLEAASNKISVSTYLDYNQNGVMDDEEQEMPYQHFLFQPDGVHFYTTQAKEFVSLPPGSHDLFMITPLGWQLPIGLSPVSINLPLDDRKHYSFGIFPDSLYTKWETKIVNGTARCSSVSTFTIHYKNIGTTKSSANLTFKPDTKYTIISTDPVITAGDNHELSWDIGLLNPQQGGLIKIKVQNPNFESMGDTLSSSVITSFSDLDSNNFSDTIGLALVATCSYDPNDIQVNPIGLGEKHLTLKSQELDYLIRFQNTGNDTAYNIVVENKLSEHFDTNSLKIIGSSHNMSATSKDNILKFNFENIMLPDSLTDEPGSHGYILYSISPKKSLPDSTVLNNKAEIYFDYNPAIVTNIVFNTIVEKFPEPISVVLGIERKPSNAFLVYPIPASTEIIIERQNNEIKTVNYQILNIKGQVVLSSFSTNRRIDYLSVKNLSPGIYFLKANWKESIEIHRIIVLN